MCDICAYAESTGKGYPPKLRILSHCQDCHRSWNGFREAHCPVCCAHFSADSVAEKHRVKDRCMTREEMLKHVTEAGKPVFRCVVADNGETWRNAETLRLSGPPAFIAKGARIG